MLNIIFHHPLPLNKNASSASGIRPLRMLAAFESLGCRVDLVTGYAAERKRCISKIKENVRRGKRYALVYSESSTMPTVLTDPSHIPLHPLMDWFFFRFCKKNSIPIGLFYRDIYWLFDSYGKGMNPIKAAVAKAAYRFDLWVYQRTLAKLYLPSLEMGRYVPGVNPAVFADLPPGHNSPTITPKVECTKQRALKLFYVGGMSSHYQLHKLFDVVRRLPKIQLTICTREAEWLGVKDEYPRLSSNIQIIHETGEVMETHLKEADIAVLFVKPQEYWKFASPVKLYEYLGYQKPVLASEGTLSECFVKENGIGWTIPYEEFALTQLLNTLSATRKSIDPVRENLRKTSSEHTWKARAKQVIKELTE